MKTLKNFAHKQEYLLMETCKKLKKCKHISHKFHSAKENVFNYQLFLIKLLLKVLILTNLTKYTYIIFNYIIIKNLRRFFFQITLFKNFPTLLKKYSNQNMFCKHLCTKSTTIPLFINTWLSVGL